MSKAWATGSTRQWRRIRSEILTRDQHRCQLQLPGCTTTATHVHHTRDRRQVGDNRAHLIAACQHCNLKTGQPGRHNPKPQPRTRW